MSASVTSERVVETQSAPLETGIGRSFEYTDIVHVQVNKNAVDSAIEEFVEQRLEGCGKVDLVKVVLNCLPTVAGASVKIGTSAIGSAATCELLSMTSGGYAFVASGLNAGVKHSVDIVPISSVSRQIRPASTNLPMLRLALEKTDNMLVILEFYIRVEGARVHYDTIE